MKLTTQKYRWLYSRAFKEGYPGYRPKIVESPDGDGRWDQEKHYSHVALKYLSDGSHDDFLYDLLYEWVDHAMDVACDLGIPQKYWPHVQDSTIRVLAYPPCAMSHRHTDFDLFTLPMYRNLSENYDIDPTHRIHYGELMTEINPEYQATPHSVAMDKKQRTQYAAVFFAMPRLDVKLPSGLSVGDWVNARKGLSRRGVK